MNDNKCKTISERQRRAQLSLLAAFDEIAQNCLKMARGGKELGNPMESYLDGGIAIDGAYYRRRSVLLAVHDMKGDKEAPLALQRKTLARLICLQMLPIPKLTLYRDVATAILRIEAFIRLSVAQGADVGMRQPINLLVGVPQWEEARRAFHASMEAASLRLAEFQAILAGLHAPRLPALTLNGLRYHWASGLRTIIST